MLGACAQGAPTTSWSDSTPLDAGGDVEATTAAEASRSGDARDAGDGGNAGNAGDAGDAADAALACVGAPDVCCTPSCAGKACGASDGCGGICLAGTCGTGQRCVAGSCTCDPTSCTGCCSGNACVSGHDDGACGRGGAVCAPCSGSATCGGGGQVAECGTSFVKYGDDGTASCDTYCAGAVWGSTGTCIEAQAFHVPCGQAIGLLTNGAELLCRCHDASGKFEKHGNNGTVSCATFCGPAVCDIGMATRVPCSQPVGKLTNGAELRCVCRGAVSCSATACPSPANGYATCSAGKCSRTCDPGFTACATGCCASPPAFLKNGDDGTVSCGAYCAGSAWGQIGTCVLAQALDVPCTQATGFFTNNSDLSCTCQSNGHTFDKPGNDGSVSCATYCSGAQWGPTGTCVHAAALDVPCAQNLTTGHLTNGTNLQCTCQ